MPKEKFRLDAINTFQRSSFCAKNVSQLDFTQGKPLLPPMMTISINGGRKSKIRPGDILGALTTACGIDGKLIGKIDIFDLFAYIAVDRSIAKEAVEKLSKTPVKGKRFIVRLHDMQPIPISGNY
jgi:ATP-dependent RNA helicase DbpA